MRKVTNKRPYFFWILTACLLCQPLSNFAEEDEEIFDEPLSYEGHSINFNDVPVVEFIRFVSKISEVNFIFDNRDLQFNVTLSSGKPVSSENVLKALIQMLRIHGFSVKREENYYVVHRMVPSDQQEEEMKPKLPMDQLIAGDIPSFSKNSVEHLEFSVYKLKYHQGAEIEDALKKIAADLKSRSDSPQNLLGAIQSMQWVKATNSLFYSGDDATVEALKKIIDSLDIPLKQVFIEVLVVETDVRKSMEFGLQWAAGAKFNNKVGFGMGAFPAASSGSFANTMRDIGTSNTPAGLSDIAIGKGFDMGVIGDIILHKGRSFFTLGSLVSALQMDGDSTIVLNQKIITQDNKNSTVFVGDNIPFTGSIVQTVGQGQQTTANVEYRDIGVSLSITPMLGEDNVITMDIDQEITEAIDHMQTSSNQAEGIRTTKTNMATHVHVPDQHFLVLSGMARNAKSYQKAGLPCLGGLPVIGSLFSKTKKVDEKRNIIIFVRPHIIKSFDEYKRLSDALEPASMQEVSAVAK